MEMELDEPNPRSTGPDANSRAPLKSAIAGSDSAQLIQTNWSRKLKHIEVHNTGIGAVGARHLNGVYPGHQGKNES